MEDALQMPDPDAEPGTPSLGRARFETCRWHQAAEAETPAHCGHRDVLPLTGTHGFNPDSWCPECELYKLRRGARKTAAPSS